MLNILNKIFISFFMVLCFTTVSFCCIITPDNIIKDYYGSKIFYTKHMKVTTIKNSLIIKIYTNYPIHEIDYNIADIEIKDKNNNSIAIKMSGKNKGDVILNPHWITSEIFKDINESCKDLNNNYINVFAKQGNVIGKATINEYKLEDGSYEIIIIVALKLLNDVGEISWGTAMCGNSLIKQNYFYEYKYIPHIYPNIDLTFKNDNPVIPYYSGIPIFFGGSVGGGDSSYDDHDEYIVVVPIPSSITLFFSFFIAFFIKIYYNKYIKIKK